MAIFAIYKSILIYQKHHLLSLMVLFICLLTNVASTCINPLIYRQIFDSALPEKNTYLLVQLLLVIAALFVLSLLSTVLQNIISTRIGVSLINHLRLLMFRNIQNLPVDENESHITEKILARFTEDIPFLEHTIIYTLWLVTQYLFIGVISICLLVYTSWQMTILVAALMPVIFIWPRWLINRANRKLNDKKQVEAQMLAMEKEGILLQETIRQLQIQNYKRKLFKFLLKKVGTLSYFYNSKVALASRSAVLGINFITLIILSTGLYLVILDQITLGAMVSFLVLLGNVGSAINFLSSHYPNLLKGIDSLERIQTLVDQAPQYPARQDNNTLVSLNKEIAFKGVSIQQGGKKILSNIDIKIPIGQAVAFVGHSGAGKSSLLKLLLREQRASVGEILLDGVDLQSFSASSLYSQIRLVPQRSILFPMTIKQNILLGKLNATDKEMIAAAKLAEIHDEIINLPKGYDTDLSTNQLSGGQQQRIALTRALIAKPAILCLDEATSGLDPITASALDKTFLRMSGDITLIYVTHRLQSVVNMNQIFVIDKGRIAEHGSHHELLNEKSLYYQLWVKQHNVEFSEDMHHARITVAGLKAIPIFEELNDTLLNELTEQFTMEKFEPYKIVFEEEDYGDTFYIIVSGIVEVSLCDRKRNERIILAQLTDGDFFGEAALLNDRPRNARITTKGVCVFLKLHRQQFHRIFSKLPQTIQTKLLKINQKRISKIHSKLIKDLGDD